jgi:hypothetical protein
VWCRQGASRERTNSMPRFVWSMSRRLRLEIGAEMAERSVVDAAWPRYSC